MASAASMMPSPNACSTSAFQRPEFCRQGIVAGKEFPRHRRWFRYSQITGLSNSTEPSSNAKAGILPKGLMRRNSMLLRALVLTTSSFRPSS